jgi:hypothetical protein
MKILLAVAAAFVLTACQHPELITEHLQKRDCKTRGSLIAGGLLPPAIQVEFECPKPE